MSATNLQLNTYNVQFNSTNIKKVTSFSPNPGGELIKFSGDNDRYPTVIANAMNNPTVSVTTGDIGTMQGFAPGTVSTITATMGDALAASGGAINWTISNAVFRNHTPSQPHGNFGSTTAEFDCYSSDGSTSPFSISRS